MSTDTPDRAELSALLSEQWASNAALVRDLDENTWRAPSPLPGWTVFDVLAHLVAIESWLLGEPLPARDPAREKIDVTTLPHVRNEFGVQNEIWLERLRPLTGEALLARFEEVTDARRTALAKMDEQQWNEPTASPIGQVPYGRFMRVRLFDCWLHELDIADALDRTVEEGGPRGDAAFGEITGGLPRVLVKLGGAPDGSRIRFELTGPLARTLDIAVQGRARYVDGFDEPPTVTLGLDSGLLARLCGGRTTADTHLDDITLGGDEELGLRLVRNLAFTI